ncbi:MAG: hypothetical protein ACSLE1_18500 [Sphingobium sp.]
MKQPTVRPARAAIAAVLAFASTPLLAQEAAPTAPPPIAPTQAAPAPVIAAPTLVTPPAPVAAQAAPAPVMAAPSAVVQPTPAPTPVAVEAAPEASASPREASRRVAPTRTNSARAQAVTPAAPNRAAVELAPSNEVATAAPLASTNGDTGSTATEETTPAVVPVSNTAAQGSNGLEWGLAGGAVVLIGGLGLIAMRRRRPVSDEMPIAERLEPVAQPIAVNTTMDRQPAMTASDYVEPRAAYPAMTAAGTRGSLEARAAEGPSATNPFLTRKNRLRRAHFTERQQGSVGTAIQAPLATAAAPVQEQRRASPVYDFGGGMTQRRGLRPATT